MNSHRTSRSESVKGESKLTDLEKRLLDLSKYFLSARKLRYKDDIPETLESLSFFRHPLASIGRLRARGKFYCGIDGEYYRSSDFVTWTQAKPLFQTLREKIKSGEFDPDWSIDICP